MDFAHEKSNALRKIDKSSKKSIDKQIKSLVAEINKLSNFYTTSSCSGRFVIVKELGKKIKNAILLSYHSPPKLEVLLKDLRKILESNKQPLFFKYEPSILHVVASSTEKAARFVEIARQLGFKKSGFYFGRKRKRPVIELISTETLALPIAKNGKLLVGEKYLSLVLNFAKKLHNKNNTKIKKLFAKLKNGDLNS